MNNHDDSIWPQKRSITDDVQIVSAALVEYKLSPLAISSFITAEDLYRVYRRYVAGKATPGLALSRRQFGIVLARVYQFDRKGPDPYRVQRRINGQRMWGYIGLVGPLCRTTATAAGRPPHEY